MKAAFTLLALIVLVGCSPDQEFSKGDSKALQSHHIEIISATYGNDNHFADVTERTITLLNTQQKFYARPEWLEADPHPKWNKAFVLIYTYKGKRHLFSCGEGGRVDIPSIIKNTSKHR